MEPSLVHVSGTAGYYSRYMFRGLDVAYRTGIDKNNESAFVGTNAAVSIGNFAVGAWYIQSLNSYVPGGASFDNSFGNLKKPLSFKTPPRERYQEYDLFANYTFRLTHDLALTAGMNYYWFSDGRFWAQGSEHINSTMEAAASLNWTGIPYLNQSLSYYYDFDAFKGGFLEYKAFLRPIQLCRRGDFAIGLSPSLGVSYDFRYNGTNNGWNNLEPGLDLPIRITEGLSLNVGVKYSWDLNDHSVGAHGAPAIRTDDRLWFSASFQYQFPTAEALAPRDGKVLSPVLASSGAEDPGRWRVSAGAGMRTMHASFEVGRAAPYDLGSLFGKKTGGGDLGFATDKKDAHYLDGSVFGNSSNFGDGTSDFTVKNTSQVTDDTRHGDGGINRQIAYHSEEYKYSKTDQRDGFNHTDDDQVAYPYLNLSYDVVKTDRFTASIGVGYAYNHSSMESGSSLVGVQTATEKHSAHAFIYNIDELFSTNAPFATPFDSRPVNYYIIYDGRQYDASYGAAANPALPSLTNLGPQHIEAATRQVVAAVAAFRSSHLDLDMHSISLPIDLSCQITDHIQARLSFGPTFNLFNENLTTETDYQLLDQGNLKVTKNPAARTIYQSPYDSTAGGPAKVPGAVRGGVSGSITGTSSGSGSAAASAPAAAGGKGSVGGTSRKLPGTSLARKVNYHTDQHFEAGLFGQLAVEVDLDAARRWFLEVYARYDYVPSFSVTDGAATAVVEASSWGSGIGVGFRF